MLKSFISKVLITLIQVNLDAMIDLSVLPKKARQELIDYYLFLVDRYVGNKKKAKKTVTEENHISEFFDRYSLDMKNYHFDREEIYGR